ncbi:MAG TPA: hypothetical protein VGC78_08355 [Gaiellaceae bacterium]
MPNRYLAIYLDDQLALGVVWREIARRAARENAGTEYGRPLAEVAEAIAEDVETFEGIMRRVGVRPKRWKRAGAVLAERSGRLKLNGHVLSYSPLSRFAELEFLTMGIDGKKQLWQTLRDLAAIDGVDFDALIARADAQRKLLEPLRASAGAILRA